MTWTRLDDQWDLSEKLIRAAEAIGSDAPLAMWVRAVTYCNRVLSDGRIHGATLRTLTRHRQPQKVIDALVQSGALIPLGEDAYEIHDFLEWNEPRAEVEARRAKKAAAGAKGGKRSGEVRSGKDNQASANQDGSRIEAGASPELGGSFASGSPMPNPFSRSRSRSEISPDLLPPQLPPETRAPTPAGGGGRAALPGFGSDPELTPDAVLDELRRHPQLNHVVTGATHAPKTLAELARSNGVTLAQLVESVGYVASITPDGEAVSATLGRLRGAVMAVHKRTVGQRQRNRDEARPLAAEPSAPPKLPAGTGRLPPPMPTPERVTPWVPVDNPVLRALGAKPVPPRVHGAPARMSEGSSASGPNTSAPSAIGDLLAGFVPDQAGDA